MENEKDKKRMDSYLSLSLYKKLLLWLGIGYLIVFVILIPFFTLGWLKVSLGWLIGSIASLGTFILLNIKNKSEKLSEVVFKALIYGSIALIWAVILTISAICTFASNLLNGFDLFYFWTVVLSALPMLAVLITYNVLKKRRVN